MGFLFRAAALMFLVGLFGSWGAAAAPRSADTSTLLVLNGIDGPGPWYNTLVGTLRKARVADRVEMMNWGGTLLLWPNLSFPFIHESAERRLVERIKRYRRESPEGRITLVGHSAGCGVIVKALERLPLSVKVDTVVLLAPCVGKKRELSSALNQVSGTMHVFYSKHDRLLLGMQTVWTGTYDHAWTEGAGYTGFTNTSMLAPELRERLQQHAYNPAWRKLGHKGGHFGYRDRDFVAEVIAPLIPVGPVDGEIEPARLAGREAVGGSARRN